MGSHMKKRNNNWGKKARLLAQHLRPAASALLLGVGASLVLTLLRMGFTQVIRFTVDGVLLGDLSGLPAFAAQFDVRALLAMACGIAVLISVAEFAVGYVQDSRLPMGSERFVKSLRDALYSRIQRLPYSWHIRHSTGDIIQRCISDVEIVRTFVMDQLIDLLSTLFLIVTYVVVMFTMNVKMALLAFVFVPVIVGYSILFYRFVSSKYVEADEAEGALSSVVQENLTGVRVVRAFGRERMELGKFREKNGGYMNIWLKLGDWLSAFWTLGDMMSIIQVFSIVVLGVHMCVSGEVTLGVYLAFVSYTRQLTMPVRRLGRVISEMSKAGVSIDRLLYILESDEEQTAENPKQADLRGEIRFENVSFAYEENAVLQDVSFAIAGGKTLGVFGETGSGKSTIALLLSRLYDPQQGRVTIGGVDVKEMDLGALRRGVGVVLQEPFLFSRTLKENIAITDDKATMDDVERAARDACLDASVGEFVNGYDTIVGERGVTLSGGQKQRTAIARTLLSGAPVMVFDDALSAVDAKTDEAIRTRLRSAAGGSTLILIAHRVATLMQSDHIIVLENGRIIESGTPQQLLEQGGVFARAAQMQSAMGEEARA